MYLPGVSVGAITGVAVSPPGQSGTPPRRSPAPRTCCRSAASRSACPSRRRCRRCCRRRRRRSPISRGPAGVCTSPTMSGGKRLCICRGWLSSCSFHSSFMFFDAGRRDERLVALPRRPLRVAAVGQPVRFRWPDPARAARWSRPPRHIAPLPRRSIYGSQMASSQADYGSRYISPAGIGRSVASWIAR